MSGDALGVDATISIAAGRVTVLSVCSSKYATIRATASSPATITDTAISMLEAHSELREWTASGGDRMVSGQSFDLDLGGPFEAGEAPPTSALGATFPWF